MRFLKRLVRAFPALLVSPLVVGVAAIVLAVTDAVWWLFGKRLFCGAGASACQGAPTSASVIIPNWNGKDLLEKYLPSVVEAVGGKPDHARLVVDPGAPDGSADVGRKAGPHRELGALAQRLGVAGEGAVRQAIGQFAAEAAALRYTGLRQLTRQLRGLPPGPEGSSNSR